MAIYPTVTPPSVSRYVTDTFLGYDHNPKIPDGAFYHMENLTGDRYPLLSNRAGRSIVAQLDRPHGIHGKARLAYIDGERLFYGDCELTEYFARAGLSVSEEAHMLPKQLVSMGAYLIVYPDKLYINTEQFTDCGSLEHYYTSPADESIRYTICTADVGEYPEPTASVTEPEAPQNGDMWLDISTTPHTLKRYSSHSDLWVEERAVYVKISATGIGAGFAKGDGVTISGVQIPSEEINAQFAALNGNHVIHARADDYIVIAGQPDVSCVQLQGSVSVSRTMPRVDFLTEASNRLWGCRYGLAEDGRTVNEIYCCGLGDFKNWNRFMGVSTDSYAASVGSDGPWTGAATYLGCPIFFKEHCLHKVIVSPEGAHRIIDTACRGVESGSHGSLAVVGETLLYSSPAGIMAYDGSLPLCIGSALGDVRYHNAVAGALGDQYYVSMTDEAGDSHLFVYDIRRGFWHREDGVRALGFARCGSTLYFIDEATGQLMAVGGGVGTPEEAVRWQADTGVMGYSTVEQKYVSRLLLRMHLGEGAYADAFIRYDSQGPWHHVGHASDCGLGSFLLPLRPRRCDHFALRLQGVGDVRLYSMARVLEQGSDEVWH